MSENESIIIFAVILMVVDIFLNFNIPTFISYILFTYVFYTVIELNFMYKILLTIIFFFAFIVFHYIVWSNTIHIFIDKFISKDKYIVGIDGLKGEKGRVKIIQNTKMAYIKGDLYEFSTDNQLRDGDYFKVKEIKDGKIII